MITLSLRHVGRLGAAAVLCIGGCATALPVTPNYTVAVGSTISIRLQTIGAGNPYDSIPQLSSAAVRFVDATQPDSLINPGGPDQLYRFVGQAPGVVTITFRKSGTSVVVSDVVEVR